MIQSAQSHPDTENLPGTDVTVSNFGQLDILVERLHAITIMAAVLRKKSGLHVAGRKGRKWICVNLMLAAILDAQIVRHGEHSEYAISADIRDVLVGLVCHDSLQRYVSVLHDDVYRRNSTP